MPRKGPDTRTSRHNPNVPDIPGPPETTITSPGQHSFVRPLASEPNPTPAPVSLDIRGKIGQTVFQGTLPWISHYQHAPEKMLQRRRLVKQRDRRSHAQLLNRSRFAAAVRGWKVLTTEQKAEYNRQGNTKHPGIEGLNVWIREFISTHDLSEFQLEATLRQAQQSIPFKGPGP